VVGSELLLGSYTHNFGKHSKGHTQCFRRINNRPGGRGGSGAAALSIKVEGVAK